MLGFAEPISSNGLVFQSSSLGAFKFAQLFLAEAKSGTLIFTGATAGKLWDVPINIISC